MHNFVCLAQRRSQEFSCEQERASPPGYASAHSAAGLLLLLLWAHAGTDRQTPDRFIDPVQHTTPAVPVTTAHTCLTIHEFTSDSYCYCKIQKGVQHGRNQYLEVASDSI